jgi:hypothetical protein
LNAERLPGAAAPADAFTPRMDSINEDFVDEPTSSPSSVSFDSSSSSSSSTLANEVDSAGPPRCQPFQVEFCKQLPYNFTAFPNAMGHKDVDEAADDIRGFK